MNCAEGARVLHSPHCAISIAWLFCLDPFSKFCPRPERDGACCDMLLHMATTLERKIIIRNAAGGPRRFTAFYTCHVLLHLRLQYSFNAVQRQTHDCLATYDTCACCSMMCLSSEVGAPTHKQPPTVTTSRMRRTPKKFSTGVPLGGTTEEHQSKTHNPCSHDGCNQFKLWFFLRRDGPNCPQGCALRTRC